MQPICPYLPLRHAEFIKMNSAQGHVPMKRRTTTLWLRCIYLGGMTLAFAYLLVNAPWQGNSYSNGQARGTFGIDRYTAPVWDPPRASGQDMYSVVQWPWESRLSGNVVELSLVSMAAKWSFAAIVLGLICGGWYRRITDPGGPDLLLHLAWSIALMMMIAWPAILTLGAFSAGYAPESFYAAILFVAFVAGVALGLWNYRRETRRTDVRPQPT
jgi:hypothetical protein